MLGELVCLEMSKKILQRRAASLQPEIAARLADPVKYVKWRSGEGDRIYNQYFRDLVALDGKDVVDLGCGSGGISYLMAAHGSKSVVAIDLNEVELSRARQAAQLQPPGIAEKVEFKVGTEKTIPVESNKADVVFMYYVLPAVAYPQEILTECYRVLRPGGHVCINFNPWFHPYGAAIENLLPIPWCHVFFSERSLVRMCAKLHAWNSRPLGYWDYDENGLRKPSKCKELLEQNSFDGVFGEGLTVKRFARLIESTQFRVAKYHLVGFRGRYSKFSRPLLRFSLLREFFTSLVVCVLRK
jgi:ubiquinone/menaquinone biosynthesis C-methylase UbiE